MKFETVSGPAIEPVSVDEAREQYRNEFGDESDSFVSGLVAAARSWAEGYIRARLITQTVRGRFAGFPPVLTLPIHPVQAVASITYLDAAGEQQTLAPEAYRLVSSGTLPFIAPSYAGTWPVTRMDWDAVTVELEVGYGDAASDVPPEITQAIKMMVGHFYRHREAVSEIALSQVPLSVEALLGPSRFWV